MKLSAIKLLLEIIADGSKKRDKSQGLGRKHQSQLTRDLFDVLERAKTMEQSTDDHESLIKKAAAFEELLAIFVPDTRYQEMLTTLDDDQMTGKRAWPTHRTPTMKEVRDWAELSERLKEKRK